MSRATIISVLATGVALLAVAVAIYERSWIPAYGEAEPLHPVAAEFGRSLVERLANEHRQEVLWSDVISLLADERFVRLRDRGFLPSSRPEILITIRVNDRFDFPIQKDGFTRFDKR